MRARRLMIGGVAFPVLLVLREISMGFGKTFVLCSSFSGTLVMEDGEPVAGVRVERAWKWGWNSKTGRDEAVTGADGSFQFPEVTGSSLLASVAPHEPSIGQIITAHGLDRQVEIWHTSKRNYDRNGELDGRPIEALCFFDREPSADGLFWGTCVEAK